MVWGTRVVQFSATLQHLFATTEFVVMVFGAMLHRLALFFRMEQGQTHWQSKRIEL